MKTQTSIAAFALGAVLALGALSPAPAQAGATHNAAQASRTLPVEQIGFKKFGHRGFRRRGFRHRAFRHRGFSRFGHSRFRGGLGKRKFHQGHHQKQHGKTLILPFGIVIK